MAPRKNRPRRAVSRRTIAVLRLFGWRYSTTREAYVHRIGRGRSGPVFVDAAAGGIERAVHDTTIFDALVAAAAPTPEPLLAPVAAPKASPAPMPPAIAPDPLPARSSDSPRPRIPVKVRLDADDEPRLVHVDGRPPLREGEPSRQARAHATVVPIRSRRATA